MKKRAVLFLLVLCAVLCFTFSALAKTWNVDSDNPNATEIFNAAQSGDEVYVFGVDLKGQDITIKSGVTAIFSINIYYNPAQITIENGGILTGSVNDAHIIECDITNRGTIRNNTKDGKSYNTNTYSGTIYNYGTIEGGTFTGKVINMPGGKVTGGDLSQAELLVQDESGNQTDGTNDSSFAGAYITVTLDANGGTLAEGAPTTQKIRRGAKLSTAAPTLKDKTFAYWEDTNGGYYYVNDAISCPHSATSVTLKAVWCDYLVTYETATDTILDPDYKYFVVKTSMLPQPFMKGETAPLSQCKFIYLKDSKYSSVPYTFYCWNTEKDGTGKSYMPGANYTPTGNITLYPYWERTKETGLRITMKYKTDKPSTTERSDVQAAHKGIYTLKSPSDVGFDTPRGYEFDGWMLSSGPITYTDDNGTHTVVVQKKDKYKYEPGEVIFVAVWEYEYTRAGVKYVACSELTEINAVWKPLPVTQITFDANGSDVTGETGTGNKETYYKDETLPLPKNGFARKDHTFTGWNTRPDGTGTPYGDGVDITITGDELVGQTVTLYAQWKSNVEPATPTPQPETPTPTPTQRPVPPTTQPTNPPPQTGDASNQPLWLALCMASVAAMAALVVMKKRRFFQR